MSSTVLDLDLAMTEATVEEADVIDIEDVIRGERRDETGPRK